ncbi:MAG: RnfABCDGE type electron transport complex subunit B [Methylococcaceae bacterium]
MIDQINALLPQTQCGQCGFNGCKPYATAIAQSNAPINQCPPGGDITIRDLAQLLQRAYQPLNPQFGTHKTQQRAVIIEDKCIACVKCIVACPVDAIIGSAKHAHTVIAQECTGCELCIAPCPVDCIVMQPAPELESRAEQLAKSAVSKKRYEARLARQAIEAELKAQRAHNKKLALLAAKTK